VLLVKAGEELAVLGPLPVRKFPGIGPVAEQKLTNVGLMTLADVARAPLPALRKIFGAWAEPIQKSCRGQGMHELGRERPAFLEYDPANGTHGTLSNERTFREDVRDPACIEAMLCSLCERVCFRARKRGVKARTVTLKLRYADFETLQRSQTITATCSELELFAVVERIFKQARKRRTAIRLLGIRLSNLEPVDLQLSLFDHEKLHQTMDGIRKRYGYDALRIALGDSRRSG
jgi:DNA polymerase-4